MIRCFVSDLCELFALAVFLIFIGCIAEAVTDARAPVHSMPHGAVAYVGAVK